MADLLSSDDWNVFDGAIGDLFDTFANINLTLRRKTRSFSGYDTGDNSEKNYTDVIVRCLSIFDQDGNGAENDRMHTGNIDLSEGYFLVYWRDLESLGLTDPTTKKPLINSALDTAILQGDIFNLVGDEQVGPFDDRYAVVKLHFKRQKKVG